MADVKPLTAGEEAELRSAVAAADAWNPAGWSGEDLTWNRQTYGYSLFPADGGEAGITVHECGDYSGDDEAAKAIIREIALLTQRKRAIFASLDASRAREAKLVEALREARFWHYGRGPSNSPMCHRWDEALAPYDTTAEMPSDVHPQEG